MGEVVRFDVSFFRKKYTLNTFVETGTGTGLGLESIIPYGFSAMYSCEIVPELYEKSRKRLQHNHINLYCLKSVDFLTQILPSIEDNILFWLDAHLPGVDFGMNHTVDSKTDILPLESELKIICELRKDFYDVILIDDARFYQRGNFKNGNCLRDSNGLGFVYSLFKDRDVQLFLHDEGYLLVTPI